MGAEPVTRDAGECPDLETLAAYLDGRVAEGDRARIAAHLTACESCYFVFAEAARMDTGVARDPAPPRWWARPRGTLADSRRRPGRRGGAGARRQRQPDIFRPRRPGPDPAAGFARHTTHGRTAADRRVRPRAVARNSPIRGRRGGRLTRGAHRRGVGREGNGDPANARCAARPRPRLAGRRRRRSRGGVARGGCSRPAGRLWHPQRSRSRVSGPRRPAPRERRRGPCARGGQSRVGTAAGIAGSVLQPCARAGAAGARRRGADRLDAGP